MATEDDYAPFNFMNNGNADGFNKDMLAALRGTPNLTWRKVFYRGPDY